MPVAMLRPAPNSSELPVTPQERPQESSRLVSVFEGSGSLTAILVLSLPFYPMGQGMQTR